LVLVYPQRPSAALRRRSGEEKDRVDAREERKDENLDRRPLHLFNLEQRDSLSFFFGAQTRSRGGRAQEERDAFGNRGESPKKKKKKKKKNAKEELFLRNNE